jgi:hypothetical protein
MKRAKHISVVSTTPWLHSYERCLNSQSCGSHVSGITDWATLWSNTHETPVHEDIKMDWYRAVHDIVPSQDRLHRNHMAATNLCRKCDMVGNLSNRLLECDEGKVMWDWTKGRIAVLLRTTVRHMPDVWLLCPTFNIWPPKRRRAVLWILANFVAYCLQQRKRLTCQDYYDFL